MKLSAEGKRLNDSFEGKHTLLKDGRYAAYLCPAGVPTIYNGLTRGVRLGMVVTEEEGEAMFAKEIAETEHGVLQAITRPMNQNEFDAFTICAYNIGVTAFRKSSMCRLFNKGDKAGCARAFERWVKAKNPKTGKLQTLPGLVSRRKREAALFMKPVEKPEEPYMPQAVEPQREPVSKTSVAVGAATAATAAPVLAPSVLGPVSTGVAVETISVPPVTVPPIPQPLQETVSNAQSWQFLGDTAWSFKTWAVAQPMLAGALLIGLAIYWAWPKKAQG